MLKHAPWSTRAAGIMIGRRGVCAEPTQVQFETKYNIPHQTVAKNIGTNTPRESTRPAKGGANASMVYFHPTCVAGHTRRRVGVGRGCTPAPTHAKNTIAGRIIILFSIRFLG